MEQTAIEILDANRTMSIATVRPDGWPQATIVGFANEGMRLYFLVYRDGQKFANMTQDGRIAITVGHEPAQLRDVKAVYAGCTVREVTSLAERSHAWQLLAARHPQLTDLAAPGSGEVATMVAELKFVSALDYGRAIGHTDNFEVAPLPTESAPA
jgi:nitroimidazol reductase NimA-like FMN-containing flavoprotein (pyridoxamine 5'-phosphate oxidase superfamily)